MADKAPTKQQILKAANVLERFAKKGMVGYTANEVKKKPKAKKAAVKKAAPKKKGKGKKK